MGVYFSNIELLTNIPAAILHNGNTVGHVPRNLCASFHRFLMLPNTTIRCTLLGPRVNRGTGYGLEVPVRYSFHGHQKAIALMEKVIKANKGKTNQMTRNV